MNPTLRKIAMFVTLLASAAFLLYSLRTARPTGGGGERGEGDEQAASTRASSALPPAAPADADLERYRVIIARNIFVPYKAPAPKPDTSALPPLNVDPPPPPKPPPPRTPGIDLAGWSYVGYITMDGIRYGLLESESTRSWRELKKGDSFGGATVQEIRLTEMEFGAGSARMTLSRDERFPVLPLENSATPRTPSASQTQPRRRTR